MVRDFKPPSLDLTRLASRPIDQTVAKAIEILIKELAQDDEAVWETNSWAASGQALEEVAADSIGMALVASQIGKTLPLELRDDHDYAGLHDETVIRGDLGGRHTIEGVIRADASSVGFGCLVLRAFIAERVEAEFPGDYAKFMEERGKVMCRMRERLKDV